MFSPSKYKIPLLIIALYFSSLTVQANDNYPLGSRSAAMGNASVTLTDLWAVYHNQAGLAFFNHFSLGFHHENRFFVPEYSLSALALSFPVKPGTFGLSYSHFGYSVYNETKIGLAFSKAFGEKFSAGIQLDYFNTYLADQYGNSGTVSFEGGMLAQPVDNFYIGVHVFNPIRAKIPDYEDNVIPTIFRIGMGYRFGENITTGIELEKDLEHVPVYKFGIEYQLIDNIFLRAGVYTNPFSYTFGIGYSLPKIKASFAFTRDEILGFTPHFTLSYVFR